MVHIVRCIFIGLRLFFLFFFNWGECLDREDFINRRTWTKHYKYRKRLLIQITNFSRQAIYKWCNATTSLAQLTDFNTQIEREIISSEEKVCQNFSYVNIHHRYQFYYILKTCLVRRLEFIKLHYTTKQVKNIFKWPQCLGHYLKIVPHHHTCMNASFYNNMQQCNPILLMLCSWFTITCSLYIVLSTSFTEALDNVKLTEKTDIVMLIKEGDTRSGSNLWGGSI